MKTESLGNNTFIFQFQSPAERKRVLTDGPWLFDRALLILTEPQGTGELSKLNFSIAPFWVQIHNIPIVCITVETEEILGKRIGEVLEVDIGSTGTCLGNCIRVRILMDATKRLKRGIRAKLGGCNEVTQFVIFYERLPDFCFRCGYIRHLYRECPIPPTSGSPAGQDLKYSHLLKLPNSSVKPRDAQR